MVPGYQKGSRFSTSIFSRAARARRSSSFPGGGPDAAGSGAAAGESAAVMGASAKVDRAMKRTRSDAFKVDSSQADRGLEGEEDRLSCVRMLAQAGRGPETGRDRMTVQLETQGG